MLKDMGVRGVKIQEVYSMDPDILATLPYVLQSCLINLLRALTRHSQPVHAFIFLFRYRTEDEQDSKTGTRQKHIWFANQIPDFACASVALLNIVNNIQGLEMGKELRDFKIFTKNMSPMKRGDAIDSFDFVRRIHNSFASDNDILNANMHTKANFDKYKKKQATAKALETKRAKKAAQDARYEESANATARASAREKEQSAKETPNASNASSAKSRKFTRSIKVDPNDEYDPSGKTRSKANGVKNEDDDDSKGLRRSGRARKPPKNVQAAKEEEDEPEAGFHFIAYMPIGDHVWKLDGLDKHPHDMGSFGLGGNGADGGSGDWVHVASPAMMQRMEEFEGAELEFNLMAVVHDPTVTESKQLVENIKTLLVIDTKLNGVFEDWRSMEGAETVKDVVTGMSTEFAITQADIDVAELPPDNEEKIVAEDDLLKLIELRGKVIGEQRLLRSLLRDAMATSKDDDEKARHRRHDYGNFARSWLGALAQQRVLGDLVKKG